VILLGCAVPGALAAGLSAPERGAAQASASALDSTPIIDGNIIGDAAWRGVPAIQGFWQVRPDEGRPATQPTSVYVGYTYDALVIGVICYDEEPDQIIVSNTKRDSSLDDTDNFQIILDGFLDRQNGLVFGTSPAGVQYDGQVIKEGAGRFGSGGGGFNLNWDTNWEVQTRLIDTGWSAEFYIPFKSLRYSGAEVQDWGINFQRSIRRNNEVAYWAPLDRQHNLYRVSDAGTLTDLRVPPQRNLKFTPYALGKVERGGGLDGTHSEEEFGFDLKYSITPSLTLDVTYNTDFAQVESDEQQVNLDRFSLFFPEKRPFFLENAGQFSVGTPREVELFFSRRIGVGSSGEPIPIVGGVRLSGKVGKRTNVGFLQMRTEDVRGATPRNDFTVARVNQELANRSSIGAMVVNREGDGSLTGHGQDDYNRTYAINGRWGIGDELTLQSYLAKTDSPHLSGDDHAFSLRSLFSSTRWSSILGYTEVGENFNPEVGFLARKGYRKYEAFLLRRYRPENLWGLFELRPHVAYYGYWDFDGFQETGWLHVDNHWEWKSGLEIHTGMNFTHEGVKNPFEIVSGIFVPAGEYDNEEISITLSTDRGAPLSFELDTKVGGFFSGDRVALKTTLRYRIGDTFTSELSWNYNDIDLDIPDGDFKVNLGRLKLSYSFTPKISLQALIQYNELEDTVATNLRFAWLQSANAGLYLVYNEIDDDSIGAPSEVRREFILKFSYIFDVL
jgi:hypothetical protein